ncbi:pyridoxal phosphate-dependent aminotransferase [Robiginitalea marina]|uniref:Histidinol-phosphate aminotransferase family protein n=1 Tax=Robiginitalea marina TaxID=2954105 RepID=A0ABT1AV06_9FLAO|nr:histidinol-phosphate transaminase [Robiginitalea marina]MCO5723432.1 histidinol-phosphate aminotransferase family protein [Robiginitalea marina]
MNTTDRRHWLKTIALGGGFTLMGGMPGLAQMAAPKRPLAEGPVKLNSNENPFGPSESVRRVLQENFHLGCRYPFQYIKALVSDIARKEEVPEDHVVITGGSTEGLNAAGLVYGLGGGEIIAADPTFQALLSYAEYFGGYVHRVPLDEGLSHDLNAMEQRITGKTRLVFLCNPNNPSGTLLDPGQLKDFCASTASRAVVFSDEAYYDYITEPDYPSMVGLVRQGYNVIVSKTFSKVYGLAGMRIGYLIARPDIALRLREALMANTNVLAILAAREALKDTDFYKFSLTQNEKCKQWIYNELDAMGIPYLRSHTNFVFFKSGMPIGTLLERMGAEGVQIGRPFPPLLDWARISTGTLEEVQAFTGALKKVLA